MAALLAGCTSPEKDVHVFNTLDSPIQVELEISSSNVSIYKATVEVPAHDFVTLPEPARLEPGVYAVSVSVPTTNQSTVQDVRVTADMTALDVGIRQHGIEIAMRIP